MEQVQIQDGSALVGQTIVEAGIRQKFGVDRGGDQRGGRHDGLQPVAGGGDSGRRRAGGAGPAAKREGARRKGGSMTARVLDGQALSATDAGGDQAGGAGVREGARPAAGARHRAGRRRPGLGRLRAQQAEGRPRTSGSMPTARACRADATLADVLAVVDRLNASEQHDGILVQSPLPKAMGPAPRSRCSTRSPLGKDVDGFARRERRPAGAEPAAARGLHAGRRHRTARARKDSDRRASTRWSSAAATSSASRWRSCCCTAMPP